jgi:plasmid stabilization system protein ParE
LKPVKVLPIAEKEFGEEVAWYRERDPRVASRFSSEVRQALTLLESYPGIGSRVPGVLDSAVRRMPVHKFPYHIVFLDLGNVLEVVAFAHYRRRPTYFLDRISF